MVFRERRERVHRRLLQCPRSRWPHSGRRKRPPSEHMQVEGAVIRPGSNQQPGFGGLSRPWNRAGPSAVEFVIDQEPENLDQRCPVEGLSRAGRAPQKAKGADPNRANRGAAYPGGIIPEWRAKSSWRAERAQIGMLGEITRVAGGFLRSARGPRHRQPTSKAGFSATSAKKHANRP